MVTVSVWTGSRATSRLEIVASPKSSTFTTPSGVIMNIARLQIAMDNALFVRCFESIGYLPGVIECSSDWQRGLEGCTGHQLHHQGTNAIRFLHAVDLRHVRVIQRRECRGLRSEEHTSELQSLRHLVC